MQQHPDETVTFRQSPFVSGVEVMDADHTPRLWRAHTETFALVMSRGHVTEFRYRGAHHILAPRAMFCSLPDEFYTCERVLRAGSFSACKIDVDTFSQLVAERAPHVRRPMWRSALHQLSVRSTRRLSRAFANIRPGASVLEVERAVVELADVAVMELLDDPRAGKAPPDAGPAAIDRARELLHQDEEGWTDLATLARVTGLSRFQVLRGFKKRFGVSPHEYQVCRRITKGGHLVRRGIPLSHVAAECGFADQSHFTRCFKQIWGLTPAQFARRER